MDKLMRKDDLPEGPEKDLRRIETEKSEARRVRTRTNESIRRNSILEASELKFDSEAEKAGEKDLEGGAVRNENETAQ